MIISTLIREVSPTGEFPRARYIRRDATHCYFECNCGETFRFDFKKQYSPTNLERIACRWCRHASYRQPHRGERDAFRRIKADAKNRGREFSISIEWFISECHKPCHYCGAVDSNKIKVKIMQKQGAVGHDIFRYNGLDRIDSGLGYTKENCVSCCWICNRAKRDMSQKDFMEWIDRLVKRNGGMS